MRCIFCKQDSSQSRSVEHIIPESLGNTKSCLSPGVVCDKCNNYFATSVESQVLNSPFFKNLRARNIIKSKKGKIPTHQAFLPPYDDELRVHFTLDENPIVIDMPTHVFEHVASTERSWLLLPEGSEPEKWYVSRFLSKMAIEALAKRVQQQPGWESFIIDDIQFDLMRNFARFGRGPKEWPFSFRKIYSEFAYMVDENGKKGLINYENPKRTEHRVKIN